MRYKTIEETMYFEFSQLNMMRFEPCDEQDQILCQQCIEKKEPLPPGYFQDYDGEQLLFFKVCPSEKEFSTIRTLMETRKVRYLKTIKNCFVILTGLIIFREIFNFIESLSFL